VTFQSFPKPRPRRLEKQDRDAARTAIDRRERAKCRARSEGQCEVIEIEPHEWSERCSRRATQNHHLISGIGKRNVGRSILAEHRIAICDECHQDISDRVLVPSSWVGREDVATVRYRRRS
jgi:hypothetical protein